MCLKLKQKSYLCYIYVYLHQFIENGSFIYEICNSIMRYIIYKILKDELENSKIN